MVLTILEDLVLRKRRDPLLEVAVADGQDRPLLIQKRHPRREHGHLVLQSNSTVDFTNQYWQGKQASKQRRESSGPHRSW